MAQRRMFNKTVTNNDTFLEMPDSSQNLYFHLSMNADDDGFVNNWKSIMRMTGHKDDDLKVLIAKQYIIPFESGVIVIRHWRLNNYLQKDRIVPTNYKNELSQLYTDNNNVYNMDTKCIHSIDKYSIEENSIDKNRIDNNTTTIINKEKSLFEIVEENFGRTISPLEIEEIESWEDNDLTRYAIKQAVTSNKCSIKYISKILFNYKKENIKTVQQAIAREEEFSSKKNIKKPSWVDIIDNYKGADE